MSSKQRTGGLRKQKSTSPRRGRPVKQSSRVRFEADIVTPEVSPDRSRVKGKGRQSTPSPESPESPLTPRKTRTDNYQARVAVPPSSGSPSKGHFTRSRTATTAATEITDDLNIHRTRSGRVAKPKIARKPVPFDFSKIAKDKDYVDLPLLTPSPLFKDLYRSNYEKDSDDFYAQIEASMGLLLHNIADEGDTLHHKLEDLISERNYDAVNDAVNVHVTSYDWRQPQLPLGKQTALLSGVLNQKKKIEEGTKMNLLETVLRLDGDYHNAWSDLNTLKELWGRHRTTWREHYRGFREQRNELLSVEMEAKDEAQSDADGLRDRTIKAIKAIDRETKWFEDNQLLEKTLIERFALIQRQTRKIDNTTHLDSWATYNKHPNAFSLDLTQELVDDISISKWWNSPDEKNPGFGFIWWLVGAGWSLENDLKILRRKQEILERDIAISAADIADKVQEIDVVEDTVREEAVATQVDYLTNMKTEVQILQQRQELDLMQTSIVKLEIATGRALQQLVKRLQESGDFPPQTYQITDEIKYFVTRIYVFVCSHFQRQETRLHFTRAYINHELFHEQRVAVIKTLKIFVKTIRRLFTELNDLLGRINDNESLIDEAYHYSNSVTNAYSDTKLALDNIRKGKGRENLQPAAQITGHRERVQKARPELDSPDWPDNKPWGSIRTYEQARVYLDVVGPDGTTLLVALIAFFMSPDVEPRFRQQSHRNTTKTEFFHNVNAILEEPLSRPAVEAFLYHCHESRQLFRLNRLLGTVARVDAGWEDADRMPVAGLQRAGIRRKPTGADHLRGWLQENQEARRLTVGSRDVSFDSFVLMLREYDYVFRRSHEDQVRELLEFFERIGRFYHFDPTDPSILHRVDNGWKRQTAAERAVERTAVRVENMPAENTFFDDLEAAFKEARLRKDVDEVLRKKAIQEEEGFKLYSKIVRRFRSTAATLFMKDLTFPMLVAWMKSKGTTTERNRRYSRLG